MLFIIYTYKNFRFKKNPVINRLIRIHKYPKNNIIDSKKLFYKKWELLSLNKLPLIIYNILLNNVLSIYNQFANSAVSGDQSKSKDYC